MSNAPPTFPHPRLNELLQRASKTPFVAQLLMATLQDLLHPQDRVLLCQASLETAGDSDGAFAFSYYSCEIVLLTTAYLIHLNFFPKTHSFSKRRVHMVTDYHTEFPSPTADEMNRVPGNRYVPPSMKVTVNFANERGEHVTSWNGEASQEETVKQLMEISKQLGRMVGVPLSSAGGPPTSGSPPLGQGGQPPQGHQGQRPATQTLAEGSRPQGAPRPAAP